MPNLQSLNLQTCNAGQIVTLLDVRFILIQVKPAAGSSGIAYLTRMGTPFTIIPAGGSVEIKADEGNTIPQLILFGLTNSQNNVIWY